MKIRHFAGEEFEGPVCSRLVLALCAVSVIALYLCTVCKVLVYTALHKYRRLAVANRYCGPDCLPCLPGLFCRRFPLFLFGFLSSLSLFRSVKEALKLGYHWDIIPRTGCYLLIWNLIVCGAFFDLPLYLDHTETRECRSNHDSCCVSLLVPLLPVPPRELVECRERILFVLIPSFLFFSFLSLSPLVRSTPYAGYFLAQLSPSRFVSIHGKGTTVLSGEIYSRETKKSTMNHPVSTDPPLADYFWIAGIDSISYGEHLAQDSKPTRRSFTEQLLEAIEAEEEVQETLLHAPAVGSRNGNKSSITLNCAPSVENRGAYSNSSSPSTEGGGIGFSASPGNLMRNGSNSSNSTITNSNPGQDRVTTFKGLTDQDFDHALLKFAAERDSFLDELSFSAGTVVPHKPLMHPRAQKVVSEDSGLQKTGSLRRRISLRDLSSMRRATSVVNRACEDLCFLFERG